jgi:hypothetical protein
VIRLASSDEFSLYISCVYGHLKCLGMAGKKDKSMIRLDYAALGDNSARDSEIPRELIKKAKGLLGRRARTEILQMMDQLLRVQAAEVARRQMDPQRLHEAGRQAVLEAIKSYQIDQPQDFREFAVAFARQAMILAKTKARADVVPLAPPPLRDEVSPSPKTPQEPPEAE